MVNTPISSSSFSIGTPELCAHRQAQRLQPYLDRNARCSVCPAAFGDMDHRFVRHHASQRGLSWAGPLASVSNSANAGGVLCIAKR